jgi:hypothetical protein
MKISKNQTADEDRKFKAFASTARAGRKGLRNSSLASESLPFGSKAGKEYHYKRKL